MTRIAALIATVVFLAVPVLGGVAASAAGTGLGEHTSMPSPLDGRTAQLASQATNDSNASAVPPGAQFAGVLGVQQAELDGEVEARIFGQRVAAAASNRSKAAVVANQSQRLQQRLEALQAQRESLRAARQNGSIDQGTFAARMATLNARSETLQRLANRTATTARGLPAATLAAKGVNVTAIRTLQTKARTLTGPEVAAIARSIAGPSVGKPIGPPASAGPPGGGPPGGGPSDTADNASADQTGTEQSIQRAAAQLQRTQARYDRVENRIDDDSEAAETLAQAQEHLNAAEDALDAAREALEEDNTDRADQLVQRALDRIETARQQINEANRQARGG
ncbi:MAG: hypothetical protein ABEI76_06060 [Halobacteriales archaeon]